MQEPKEIKSLYNRISKKYDFLMSITGYNFAVRKIIEALPDNPQAHSILDIGCGTGFTTNLICKKFKGSKITGLDFSDNMIEIYQSRFPENEALLGDFNQENSFRVYQNKKIITLSPLSYDIVISVGSILEY